MKNLFILLSLIIGSAHAFELNSKEIPGSSLLAEGRGHHRHHCRGLKLTMEQRKSIRAVVKSTIQTVRSQRKSIMTAKKALHKVMMDTSSTKEAAVEAYKGLRSALAPAMKAKGQAKLKVYFDILTPEQRVKAMKCKMRKHHRKPRRHHKK